MSIRTTCQCGFSFNAKNELAGKRVKCPRCTQALQIPSAPEKAAVQAGKSASLSGRSVNRALLDLLDEEGVQGLPQGPICQSCGNVMSASSVICVNCGFNTATGEHLQTVIDYGEDYDPSLEGKTNAELLLAQAEKDISETPISSQEQDFGDGADSIVIAFVAAAVAGILILAGLAVVLVMEYATADINPAVIAVVVSGIIAFSCHITIVVFAFMDEVVQGVLSLLIPIYAIYYGFTRGSWPRILAIVLALAFVMQIVCSIILIATGDSSP
ncbi:MAG TPA: hypothetical protein PKD64_09695 [Pirellulaceae bacterium]|nr:hypothetical protein [Pirellulaceae bacterium]HMO92459.1 hypothetical protein [Pirellulaceae bacterium]HMP67871.1 hypothetical protein [Pirellulaceae bacterium]